MKVLLTTIFAITSFFINAQLVLLNESFDNSAFPPNGWTFDGQESNWFYSNSLNAGGTQGEVGLDGVPDFYGSTRFISPTIDLSNASNVTLDFRHTFYFSTSIPGNGVIGVATRSGNSSWNSIWEVNITEEINTSLMSIPVNNVDANASDFQFCFYFTGFSYIIANWYIDDISLKSHFAHDVASDAILGNNVFTPNTDYQPEARIVNSGTTAETFDVTCTIRDQNDVVLHEETQTVTNLQPDANETITFGIYNLATSNALYKVEISTNLSNDQFNGNNNSTKNIYTYTHDRNQVLLEIGTGTWCHFCMGAALGSEDLVTNGKDVAVIEYHAEDDFSTTTGDDRLSYYNMLGFPDAYFDGVTEFAGGSETSLYSDYLIMYNEHKNIKTGLDIDLTQTFSNNEYTVTVALNKVGPIADDNLAAYLVLTESNINFAWQDLSELDFVQRLTLPDAEGHAVDLINNTSLNIPFTFQLDDSWTNDLELIAFVQNKTTKEILNTAKLPLSSTTGIETTSTLSNDIEIYPNPARDWLTINNLNKSIKKIWISDITGKEVIQINDFNSKKQIDVSALKKGIYFIKMISNDNVLVIKKFIKN